MAPTQSHDPNPSEMMGSAQGGRRYTSETPSHLSHGRGKKAVPAVSDPMNTPKKSKSTDDAPSRSSKAGGKWTIDMTGNVDAKPDSEAIRLVMAAVWTLCASRVNEKLAP